MRLTPASSSAESLAYFSRSNFSQKSLYNLLQSILVCAKAGPASKPSAARPKRDDFRAESFISISHAEPKLRATMACRQFSTSLANRDIRENLYWLATASPDLAALTGPCRSRKGLY